MNEDIRLSIGTKASLFSFGISSNKNATKNPLVAPRGFYVDNHAHPLTPYHIYLSLQASNIICTMPSRASGLAKARRFLANLARLPLLVSRSPIASYRI